MPLARNVSSTAGNSLAFINGNLNLGGAARTFTIENGGAFDRLSAESMMEGTFYSVIVADLRLHTDAEGLELLDGIPGAYVKVADTVRSFREIIEGKHDDIPEQAFYLKGGIEDVLAAAEKMKQTV